MMYNFVGDARLTFAGCLAINEVSRSYLSRFGEGSMPYILHSAHKKGILEQIFVKEVVLVDRGGVVAFNYLDKTNAVFLEEELGSEKEAVDLAILFYERRAKDLSKAINADCS